MACVTNPKDLTPTARKILKTIKDQALTVDEIVEKTTLPLFKVRSNLRNLTEIGFVNQDDQKYIIDSQAISLI